MNGINGSRRAKWVPVGTLLTLALILAAWPAAGDESAKSASVAESIFRWRPFLAPFHAVVLHFPIGFLTMAFILEVYRYRRPSQEMKQVTVLVIWLSLLSGIIAAAFGTMRAGSGGYEVHTLGLHRMFGMSVPIFTMATLTFQRLAYRGSESGGWSLAYRGMLGGTLALLLVAGHYGGNLTHGSKYLTENAPAFVRELLDKESGPAAVGATGETASSQGQPAYFARTIEPILKAKCIRCHGPEKQKGEYRLDQREVALKGGQSGRAAITPGEPFESHLVRLILLPRSHDDVMPPEGKEPLTPEETLSLVHWIQQGAPYSGPSTPPDSPVASD